MIVFDQVTKAFPNGTVALDKVTFDIEPEEFVFITGPSGAGKTTLLRLMVRELIPTEGSIMIDKVNLSDLKRHEIPLLRRKIGAAFQDFKLLPDWTITENVSLGLEILGKKPQETTDRVAHLLELVGIKDRGDLFPSQLSGGELQRAVIARALAPEPKILFADEPTGNLDTATGMQIVELLRDINDLGTTVIMATHAQDIVDHFKNRIIALDKGKMVKDIEGKSKPVKDKKHKTSTD